MAHYAFLNEDSVVVNVIVGVDENSPTPEGFDSWEDFYADQKGLDCKRTSYNTHAGVYTTVDENDEIIPVADNLQGLAFRGNYACLSGTYDAVRDVFLPPKPFNSWVYDETNVNWKAPVDKPDDYELVPYLWDEANVQWLEVTADNDPEGAHFG